MPPLSKAALPSPESQKFRAELAKLVSPLRRVRPKLPFFQLAVHRVPTLWGLYRSLLRELPEENRNIRERIRYLFRANRHLTGTERTIKELKKGYKWLNTFKLARAGDARASAILARYDRFLGFKAEKEHWMKLIDKEVAWQHRLRNRPILTGGLVFPTLYTVPFPRMKPQPIAISRIILKRARVREKRFAKFREMNAMKFLAQEELRFEQSLLGKDETGQGEIPRVFSYRWAGGFIAYSIYELKRIIHGIATGTVRQSMPIPQSLLRQLKEAKQEKIANKTRERARERAGEILPVTVRRALKGPPAHILSQMTEQEKEEDKLMRRSIAEVGYVGMLKARHGWKLHQGRFRGLKGKREREQMEREGKTWSVEDGEWVGVTESKQLDAQFDSLRRENERRRREAGSHEAE